jgi:hypothetical protein
MDVAEVTALVALLPAFAAAILAYLQAKSARSDARAADRRSRLAEQVAETAKNQAAAAERMAEAMEGRVDTARKATRAQAILDLEEELARHEQVHTALSSVDQRWFGPGEEPSRAQWVTVETYMGLFERVENLIESGILEAAAVEENYGYRVSNLVADDLIYQEKLVKRADGWRQFIRLWESLDRAHQERLGKPLSRRRSPAERTEDERQYRASARS